MDNLNKGLKHLVAGAALAVSPISHHINQINDAHDQKALKSPVSPFMASETAQTGHNIANFVEKVNEQPKWDKKKTFAAFARQESSSGKNTNHAEIKTGLAAGTHAVGKYGLTLPLIHNLIERSPKLSEKHSGLLHMQDEHVAEYLKRNPLLEEDLMDRYHSRMVKELGTEDPRTLYIAHLNGIEGAKKYLRTHKAEDHPIAQKVQKYYDSIK